MLLNIIKLYFYKINDCGKNVCIYFRLSNAIPFFNSILKNIQPINTHVHPPHSNDIIYCAQIFGDRCKKFSLSP